MKKAIISVISAAAIILSSTAVTADSAQKTAMDINGDGIVNTFDLVAARQTGLSGTKLKLLSDFLLNHGKGFTDETTTPITTEVTIDESCILEPKGTVHTGEGTFYGGGYVGGHAMLDPVSHDYWIVAMNHADYNEAQLADLIVESNKTLDEYLAAIESGKVTLANYGDQEAAVKQQIETIKENERKRIEEEKRREAARKAAEEAAKKAAEEARKAAEAAAAANQPTTTTANNVTVADQPATTAATTQPVTVAADPAPVSTGTKASIRAAIANEAPKYLGLKYVWGGTSLSTGADCSGFCWAIYKKCGVDISGLQRTSYGMASQSLGRTVSVSEAQPGDLVFYGDSYGNVNHVAIYIGNNTIIHESGYQVGCKKSSIYYRNIIKIKNFIDYL
jgi:cell wall-associated NlpC family hydrolase